MAIATMGGQIPQHIAFIMDGNGRWATRRGLPRLKGHTAGIDALRGVCATCLEVGVKYATFYTFSAENWQRPWEEIAGLFTLMRMFFEKELKNLIKQGIKVQFIGDRSPEGRLSPEILALMSEVEAATCHNTKLVMTLALNYSAREEIVRAAQLLVKQGVPVTLESFPAALDTSGIPDPDLIIRTGGEQRISNFLLWQAAYAELYFAAVPWPDFDADELAKALENYATRQRRFGGLVDQHDETRAV